jgi:hypothetical protein
VTQKSVERQREAPGSASVSLAEREARITSSSTVQRLDFHGKLSRAVHAQQARRLRPQALRVAANRSLMLLLCPCSAPAPAPAPAPALPLPLLVLLPLPYLPLPRNFSV